MNLISIVVPVYNVENYLEKCVDSILKQTYKNLEIILIDDGSTDNSGKICDQYQLKDERIKVIHKKNGGLSDARNAGIENSVGDYICFIDSDDYVEKDMIYSLYSSIIKNDADISWCNLIREYENGKCAKETIYAEETILNKKEAYAKILLFNPSVCTKMFSKKLFESINFPVGKLYEDIITMNLLIDKSNNIVHTGTYNYHYIQREDSIVHTKFNKKKLDYVKNAKILYEYSISKYPELQEIADSYYSLVMCTVINDIYHYRKEFNYEYKQLKKELKQNTKRIIKNKYIPKSKKIMCILTIYGFSGFVNIIKEYKNKYS